VTSVFPRGGESDYTLVMVDGIRLNDMGGSYDAAHLPLFDLDRIEAVRGPQSAVYGSDAVGGVVQLVTRRGGPLRATGLFEGGTFGTWRGNAAANGTAGRLRWGGGVEQLTTDGYTGIAPGTGETVSNDDYSRTDGMGSVGYLTDRLQVTGVIRAGRNERGVPGPYGSDPNDTYASVDTVSRNDNDTVAAGASAAWRLAPAFQARGSFTYANRDSSFISIYTPDTPTASSNRMWAARGQVDAAWLGVSWTAGTEWTGERAASSFITGLQDQEIPVERSQFGLFGEGRAEFGRLSIQGGARFEQVVRNALEGNRSVFSPRPAFAEDTISVVNPRVAVSWRALGGQDWWARVHGGIGTGMRAPGAFEIAFTDNPGLRPEKTRSFEGGLETGWIGGRLVADLLYFHNDYDDLIVTVGRVAGTTSYRSDNISNARSEGVEASVSFRPFAALTVRGGLVGLRTEILANDGTPGAPTPFEVGDSLLRRPELTGFVDALVTVGRVSGFFRVDGRDAAFDIDPSFGANAGIFVNPGYATADAGMSVRLLDQVEVFGRVVNLFDKQYEEIYGFPSLGRSVMVGVRLATSR
jgi:outer membrane cobalamin receptor